MEGISGVPDPCLANTFTFRIVVHTKEMCRNILIQKYATGTCAEIRVYLVPLILTRNVRDDPINYIFVMM